MKALAWLALALAAQGGSDEPTFAALVEQGDETELLDAISRAPHEARVFVYEALRATAALGDEAAHEQARFVAALLATEEGTSYALEAVERLEQAGADERSARAEVERHLVLAIRARDASDVDAALGEVQLALAAAGPVGDCYLTRILQRFAADLHGRRGADDDRRRALADVVACDARLGIVAHAIDDLLQLAELEAAFGLFDDARARLEQARLNTSGAEYASITLRLGTLDSAAGDYGRALEHLQEATERFASLERPEERAAAELALGSVLSELGEKTDALATIRRALQRLEDVTNSPTASAQVALGLALLDGGQPDEALAALDQALASEGLRTTRERGDALRHRGRALARLKRTAEARDAFRQAAHSLEASPRELAWALTGEADAYALDGQWEEARQLYERSLQTAGDTSGLEGTWRADVGLARVAESTGDTDRALQHFERAISRLEGIRGLLGAPSLRARFLGDKLLAYRRAAWLHATQGDLERAFALAESAKARTLFELTSLRRTAPPSTTEASAEARTALLRSEARVVALERRALQQPGPGLEADLERAREQHARARRAVELADPRLAVLRGVGTSPSLEDVRAALLPGETVLEYVVDDARAGVLLVQTEAVRWIELPMAGAEIAGRIDELLAPFDRLREGTTDPFHLRFDASVAQSLYEALLAPLEGDLGDSDLVWVVPDGPLRRLPFAALVTDYERRRVDPQRVYAQYEGCEFWIERRAVAYLPAAGLLLHHQRSTRAASSTSLLVDARPGREDEAAFGASRILRGADAEEAAVRDALGEATMAHFATHGVLDDARPAYSRLALAPGERHDGWLHAYEIESLAIAAEHVVLSACETVASGGRGEGITGLARAFLIAGADAVVATGWRVDDRGTTRLMEHYEEGLQRGLDRPSALRTAQLAMLEDGRPGVSYVHPFFWAGFQHFGAR